ncbi:unnamed protein product [Prunus brigantina]
MGLEWLLLGFSFCFSTISASTLLSLMRGCGFSSREFGFVSCVMGGMYIIKPYIFEVIKPDCLWPCVALSWPCVALSEGVPYKFDDALTSLRVWCSPIAAFVLALEVFVFVRGLWRNL